MAPPPAAPNPRHAERRASLPKARTAPAAAAAPTAPSWFPSPTQQARPELGRLPRQAGKGLRVGPEIPAVPMEVKSSEPFPVEFAEYCNVELLLMDRPL